MFTCPKRSIRITIVCLSLIFAALLFSFAQWRALKPAEAAPAKNNFANHSPGFPPVDNPSLPLSSLLNLDGTLNLKAGFNGSPDVSGWRMTTTANGAPRFVQGTVCSGWDTQFSSNGATGFGVNAMAVSGTDIYVGGRIRVVGGVAVNQIAKFNTLTNTWSALGTGGGNGVARSVGSAVTAFLVSGNDLYVGGEFTMANVGGASISANYVAKFDITTGVWSALGSGGGNGVNGSVRALVLSGSDLYVGGTFTMANVGSTSISVNNVAKFNTTTGVWSALGAGNAFGVNDRVLAMALSGSDLYVGGEFTKVNSGGTTISANNLAKFNTTTGVWSALGAGSGVNGVVVGLALDGSVLYVGGYFTMANVGGMSISANNMAKFNTTTGVWSALGTGGGNGVDVGVVTLALAGSDLYVGGFFKAANVGGASVSANSVAKFNTTTGVWSALADLGGSDGVNGLVRALALSGSSVFAGGDFTMAGDNKASQYIGRFCGAVAPNNVASVSAASFLGQEVAQESIIAAFGSGLATGIEVAAATPLPTALAGTTLKVKDSAGTERAAPLFFVSPGQINYQMPPGTATGTATVTVTSGDGKLSVGAIQVSRVAPGLFSANASGQGVAAAVILRIRNGVQTFEPVARFDAAQSRFVAVPIDLGPETDAVYLLLYGLGFRNRSRAESISVNLGNLVKTFDPAKFEDGFAAPGFVGLDQANVLLPRNLIGLGEIGVTLTVDGKRSNTIMISIK